MVPYKPHSATWRAVADSGEGGAAPTWSDAVAERACFAEPISSDAAYQRAMVEVRDAWLLMGDLADWTGVAVGDLVVVSRGAEQLAECTVRAVKRYSSGTAADHIELILEAR